ncbi:hypothetical protein [Luteimonas terrae]|uniref:Uncharacterized protein n=1 Tax=Luteimonas terrae TaxID=1530191 RepID=A0ABU1Y1C6_9GAMM|nr:hypothetical protein [Luteimonas terrae]MDR7194823.1 hypothetical protein [Luteimonas terrae]
MNRRLHTPIIACTASALALSAGLLFAGPALSAGETASSPVTVAVAAKARVQTERAATTTDLDAETPRPRTRRARSGFALPYFSFARGAGGRS